MHVANEHKIDQQRDYLISVCIFVSVCVSVVYLTSNFSQKKMKCILVAILPSTDQAVAT